MMEIDVKEWKEFKISDIFSFPKVMKYSSAPETDGTVPYVSSSSDNNGVSLYCDEEPCVNRCITVSTNGNCFDCFFHNEPICVSSDVDVLVNDTLTDRQMLFLCTIMGLEHKKYSYGRKPKNGKVKNTIIKLPIQHNNDGTIFIDNDKKYSEYGYIPDWKFMDDFIGSLQSKYYFDFFGL